MIRKVAGRYIWTPEAVSEMLRRNAEGEPHRATALWLGVSYDTFQRFLKKSGIKLHQLPRVNNLPDNRVHFIPEMVEVISPLRVGGTSVKQIAVKLGVSYMTLRKFCTQTGLDIGPRGGQAT